MVVLAPEDTPVDLQKANAVVTQPPKATRAAIEKAEAAEWEVLEKDLLSNSELQEVYDYLRATGQLSA